MKKTFHVLLVLTVLAVAAGLWAQQKPDPSSASPAEIEKHVETFLRTFYAWGSAFEVKVNPPAPSPIPALYQVSVVISYKGQSDKATVFVSHDGRYLIRGSIDKLLVDPFAGNRKQLQLKLDDHPSIGPAKACVTVAEFSDYECPHCRELSDILKQVEPRFPQVRFAFLDFPLEQIHPWAMNAALAGRCAYQQKPAAYAKFRRSIFENQAQITPDDASDELLKLATQAGLDANGIQACMASAATRKEVDADLALGKQLKVNSTPTVFVNGRPLIGGNEQLLEQFISYELSRCSATH
jgi:protein-disulfide isomerase